MSEIYVQKIKYEHLGMQGMCEVRYNVHNSRFCNKIGSYDNANWLLPKSEQVNLALFDQVEVPKKEYATIDEREPPF